MHQFLLGLSVLLMSSAWAAETAPPATQTSGYVQLRGAPKNIQSLLAQLRQDSSYVAAGCQSAVTSKSGNLAGISCSQPNSALTDTLNKLAPHGVKWNLSVQGCAVGCVYMACPPPGGSKSCCKLTGGVYKAC